MDLALALLVLWGLLFVPLGIVLHWFVLGEGSRVRALPLAPVTGIAAAFAILAALGRLGIDAGNQSVPWAFLAVSVACVVVIWRRNVEWRSRELIGAGLLLLLAVVLVQLPVIGNDGDGPLGYGTAVNPVSEVAAIDTAADGPASKLGVARIAQAGMDERAIGFEEFAALTVSIGASDSPNSTRSSSWSAYGLHAAIVGMLAAIVTLPLFAFARARGVRWFGLIVLVPLGVLAPAIFLGIANGEGAAIATVSFTTAAVFSLLVTRRDRGWWALVVLYGAAIAATAGPIALLPLLCVGIAWMLLRSDTYEHLSQHDAPVAPVRTLAVTGVAAGLGAIATVPLLVSGGEQLSWTALHSNLWDAVRSWPFAWLDSSLEVVGPDTPLETAIWLIGPALLAVAVVYAVVRNERRELGVLVGAILGGLLGVVIGLVETTAGIRLFEFTMLSMSPFLAALAIRAVALARENASDLKSARAALGAGLGPTLLVVAFTVLCFASTAVTGTRMVHAPTVDFAAAAERGDTAIIAAGDPWLAFVVDGERVPGGYADADAISEERNDLSTVGTRTTGYDQVILSSSPLSSDPSFRYVEQSELDRYQVRQFRDRLSTPTPVEDPIVDQARFDQRQQTQTADRPGTERANRGAPVEAASSAANVTPTVPVALTHHPVEPLGQNTPPDRPAGLLLPVTDVPGCSTAGSSSSRSASIEPVTCEPEEPVLGEGCTEADVAAARAPDDRDRTGKRPPNPARAQVLKVQADANLPEKPPMIGVQCFDVPLAADSGVLNVHLRDIGHILPPEDAVSSGKPGAWDTHREEGREGGSEGVNGGTRRTTSALNAALTYGGGRLSSGVQYDLVLEGMFGAGVEAMTDFGIATTNGGVDALPPTSLGTIDGSANGFSSILRAKPVVGDVTITNRVGTDIELGRLFARPRDLPRSCDVPIALASGEQREVRLDVRSSGGGASIERPGLTVNVVDIEQDGDDRIARVVVASYLSRSGLPRYVLVDWTEQFDEDLEIEGCDGAMYEEAGTPPPRGEVIVNEAMLEAALGETGAAMELDLPD